VPARWEPAAMNFEELKAEIMIDTNADSILICFVFSFINIDKSLINNF
jgi:hypothetical protein